LAGVVQQQQSQEASWSSPSAVAVRQASQTEYEGESSSQALATGEQAFPGQIGVPGYSPLDVGSGGKVLQRVSANEAVIEDGSGHRSLAVGALPLYGKQADGSSAPTDLGLVDDGSGYVPQSALVPVRIPQSSSGQVAFGDAGFSVGFGSVAVAGQQAGGGVFFANVDGAGSDTDAVVRPMPVGAEISFLLRSENSAQSQTLTFDLRGGWSLKDPGDGSGVVHVLDASGAVQATIEPPIATDAQGQSVPASYTIPDPTHLVVNVADQGGQYAYPILVDPYIDSWTGASIESTWTQHVTPTGAPFSVGTPFGLAQWYGETGYNYSNGATGEWYGYPPSGAYIYELYESDVYDVPSASTVLGGIWSFPSNNWDWATAVSGQDPGGAGTGGYFWTGASFSGWNYTMCARSGCPSELSEYPSGQTSTNAAAFGMLMAGGKPTSEPYVLLGGATEYESDNQAITMATPTHSGYRPPTGNGANWVNNATDTVTTNASVPNGLGLGILNTEAWGAWGPPTQSVTACGSGTDQGTNQTGAPCPMSQQASFTYSTGSMAEGVDTVSVDAFGAGGNTSSGVQSWPVDVDHTPPTVALSGSLESVNNTAVGFGQYTLNVTATDGNGSIPVSGVQSIQIYVDGQPQTGYSTTRCPQVQNSDQCSASTSWTVKTDTLTPGPNTITVTATDNAGNTSIAGSGQTISITVPSDPSEPIGPGSVNLGTGAFRLDATDVSVPAFVGSMDVTRSYDSEQVSSTGNGPLGPGWSVSLPQGSGVGSFRSLSASPDGSGVTLTDAGGGQSFWRQTSSTPPASFQSPTGLEGLTLKGPVGSAGAVGETSIPTGGANPTQVTYGPQNATWFPEFSTNKIGEIVPCSGTGCTPTINEYAIPTANSQPFGITVGPDNNIWFTERNANKIGELIPCSGTGCTPTINEYSVPTANSQPLDITAGPDGNLWFTELTSGKIGKITPAGQITEYTISTSSQLHGITVGPDGALWFGDSGTNTIGRITTDGQHVTEYPIPTAGADPTGITKGPDGALWFTEYSTNQIGRITTAGQVTEYQVPSTSSNPLRIAAGADGNLWFTEYATSKIASLNPNKVSAATSDGITEYTNGISANGGPYGISAGPNGDLWFAEQNSGKIGQVSLGAYTLTDTSGDAQVFLPTQGTTGQWSAQSSVAPNTSGGIVSSTDTYQTTGGGTVEPLATVAQAPGLSAPCTVSASDNWEQRGCRTLTFTYASEQSFTAKSDCPTVGGAQTGDYPGRLTTIDYIAYNTNGDANYPQGFNTIAVARYCYDSSGLLRAEFDPRICDSIGGSCTELPTEYSYNSNGLITTIAPPGLNAWTITYGTIPTDPNPDRLLSVSRQDPTNGTATTTVGYDVPLSGPGVSSQEQMDTATVATWGETPTTVSPDNTVINEPASATAIFPPSDLPSGTPTANNYLAATIYYMDQAGYEVNVAAAGAAISTTQYDTMTQNGQIVQSGNVASTLTAQSRLDALNCNCGNTATQAGLLSTVDHYSPDGTELQTETGPQHLIEPIAGGGQVLAQTETSYLYDQGNPGGSAATHLQTTQTVSDTWGEDTSRMTTYQYSDTAQGNLGWTLGQPLSVTTDPTGLDLVNTTLYDPTTGAVTETRQPGNPNGGDAHATDSYYYTAGTNPGDSSCSNQPDWAGEPCQTEPAAQPNTPGLPSLPVTTYSYDIWGETTTQTDTSGSNTRTTTNTYDPAGRLQSSAISSTIGQPLPTVSYGYDPATGLQTTQSAGGRTITAGYNAIGERTSYTDADGNTSTSTYDINGRLKTLNDGKGTQTYNYDTTTGELSSLQDSGAGTFAASYNADGNLLTETYPNGMTAQYGYDDTGRATSLTYTAPSGCQSNCTWYRDAAQPSAFGQWLIQQQTTQLTGQPALSSYQYQYDTAGRLTQVQDTPAGAGCTTRQYTYDADSNRLSQTTYSPGTGGVCATTAGTTSTHSYDAADRLTDSGVSYDGWGNTLTLPALDAGGNQLTASYYADTTLYSETQNGLTVTHNLDPTGRIRQYVDSGTTASTEIEHYSDGGDSPAWVDQGSGAWSRYAAGPDGGLAAIQSNSGSVTLEMRDLHGDAIGTVASTPSATPTLQKTGDEFGTPSAGTTPPRYGWLGADQRTTALPSGMIDMGAREYDPSLGRFLQTDPVPGGSANAYDYANQDPLNADDLSGDAPRPTVLCTYSFSYNTTKRLLGTSVNWGAILSCTQPMRLYGEAWLIDADYGPTLADGNRIDGILVEARSGSPAGKPSFVDFRYRRFRIQLNIHIFFKNPPTGGESLGVVAPPGVATNAKNDCMKDYNLEFGWGEACELFSYKF
jgi:RHS repeat-associated protein